MLGSQNIATGVHLKKKKNHLEKNLNDINFKVTTSRKETL